MIVPYFQTPELTFQYAHSRLEFLEETYEEWRLSPGSKELQEKLRDLSKQVAADISLAVELISSHPESRQ